MALGMLVFHVGKIFQAIAGQIPAKQIKVFWGGKHINDRLLPLSVPVSNAKALVGGRRKCNWLSHVWFDIIYLQLS